MKKNDAEQNPGRSGPHWCPRRLSTALFFLALSPVWAQTVTVSPAAGPGGVQVTLTASGFDSGHVGYNTGFYVDGAFRGACPFYSPGNCSIQLEMPAYTPGAHTVKAANSVGEQGNATFTVVKPWFEIHPSCGPAGTTVTASGRYFAVGFDAGIYFDGSLVLGGNYPDATGAFDVDIQVPGGTPGSHTIEARNSAGNDETQPFSLVLTACDEVAHVTQLSGPLEVLQPDGTTWMPVQQGDTLHENDTLRFPPGTNGSAHIVFPDNTTLDMNGGSVTLDSYVWDANSHQGSSRMSLLGALFNYTSGLINSSSSQREQEQLDACFASGAKICVGYIGIRGTRFTGRFDEATQTERMYLASGTLAIRPMSTGLETVIDAPAAFAFDANGVTTLTGPDADGDGVPDDLDNCVNVANPGQLDADGDGYGNACDADLDNNGSVTATDFALMRSVLGQATTFSALAAAADLDTNGTVTATDFAILRKALGSTPGPSALRP